MKPPVAARRCGLCCQSGPQAQVAPCKYEVTIIDQPCSGIGINGYGINEQSPPTIAGYYTCGISTDKPFYWNESEGIVTLPPYQIGSTAVGLDVNDNLQVVGYVEPFSGPTQGFVYQNGQYTIIPPLPDGGGSSSVSANTNTLVVGQRGYANRTRFGWVGFVWDQKNSTFTDIYPSYTYLCFPTDGNNRGQVVGAMGNTSISSHAFLWEAGTLTDLETIPGGYTAYAGGINDHGQIIINGNIEAENFPFGITQGYIWDDGEWAFINTPKPFIGAFGTDINDAGLVLIGLIYPSGASGNYGVWYQGAFRSMASMVPPNTIVDIGLSSINNANEIVATAHRAFPPFEKVAVLLTPVPPIVGDANCDDIVNTDDLVAVINVWGSDMPGFADLDGNGTADVDDLLIVLTNWS